MSDINTMAAVAIPVILVVILVSLITKQSDNYHPERDSHKGESSYYPHIYPMKNSHTTSQKIHPAYPYPTHHQHPQHPYDPNRHHHDHHHYYPNDHRHHPGKLPQPNLGPGGTQHLLGPGGIQQYS